MKSSLEAVYNALATRDGAAAWWSSYLEGESKLGGVLKFTFREEAREIGTISVKVLELQPARRVLWQVVAGPQEWIGTKISFDLKREGDWTIVLFKHEGWKEPNEFMHHCSTKWGIYMMSLKTLVETGKGRANPNDVKVADFD
jgi:hypothetical protein